MTYQVKITPFANRASKKFSPEVKKAAKAALKELAKNPYLGKELQAELSSFWSYKFLRYRIIFKTDTQEKTVIVWAVGHRRDIYEAFGGHLLSLSSED
ncbi:MAG: type II toxin-antitoxin system RelE/ParE family toxin [Thermodesulfobacteriota bacterium]|nr:type II toxin-antitoxin system RelE/ParE family toxin [Thermodesulfobacteriota bacterium]